MFRWEWMREYDVDPESGRRIGQEWVEAKGKPVSCDRGINREGLVEAAEEVAKWVQTELHGYGDKPLGLRDATSLWQSRLGYQNPLYWLDGNGNRLWKELESRVAPGGRGLAICVGSNKRFQVPVILHRRSTLEVMHGYPGCLQTFPENPYGRGRPWARWCRRCQPRKTNAKLKEITDLQRRVAEVGRLKQPAGDLD